MQSEESINEFSEDAPGQEEINELYQDEVIELPEKTPKKKLGKRAKATSTKGHYLTNATLLPEVIRAKKLGRITDELARMLLKMAEKISTKSWFIGYSFREDMISFAMVNLMANALKFNPEKSSNPFSFYTTAIHRSFYQYKNEEAYHRDIRDALIVEEGFNPSSSYAEHCKEADDFY
jgi:hypothetical protein